MRGPLLSLEGPADHSYGVIFPETSRTPRPCSISEVVSARVALAGEDGGDGGGEMTYQVNKSEEQWLAELLSLIHI